MPLTMENIEPQDDYGIQDFSEHRPRNYLIEESEQQQALRIAVLKAAWKRRGKNLLKALILIALGVVAVKLGIL